MKKFWLEKVIHLSSHVYKLKKRLAEVHAVKAFFYIIAVVFFEVLLAIFSFPLYLVQRKGSKSFQFRRVITLSTLGLILMLWVVKLVFALGSSAYIQNKSDEMISQLTDREVQIQDVSLINIETASVDESIKTPILTGIRQKDRGVVFKGQGVPGEEIVLNIFGKVSFVTSGEIKEDGRFEVEYYDNQLKLTGGEYTVLASVYDDGKYSRSVYSNPVNFELKDNFFQQFFAMLDLYLNIFVLCSIAFGLFLTVLVT